MKIEYNATDGDAGLQVFLDAPAWNEISITNPSGEELLDVQAEEVIDDYGLTELFAESSEPPFDEFPFEEFKKLFPEGTYTFRGTTVDGQRLRSTFRLTHDVPDGVADAPAQGNPVRVLDMMLPASATSVETPAEFLTPGTYKTEVLAIERSGNPDPHRGRLHGGVTPRCTSGGCPLHPVVTGSRTRSGEGVSEGGWRSPAETPYPVGTSLRAGTS